MLMFIFSEVLLFFSFFWGGLNAIINGELLLGYEVPSVGILGFKFYGLPFLNTLLLLVSRALLTVFHLFLFSGIFNKIYFLIRIVLGIYFFLLQTLEYKSAYFSLGEGSYGRAFFLFTGFHGAHVFIGARFLRYLLSVSKNFFLQSLVRLEIGI